MSTCSQLLTDVEKHVADDCTNLDANQSCYGNNVIGVQFQSSDTQLTFNKVGDIIPVDSLKSISTGPLNLERNEWGVAVLRLPVSNLQNTAAGQVVTFLLYGDTKLGNATSGTPANSAGQPAASCSAAVSRATNLRAKASADSAIIEVVQANTPLTVTGRLSDSSWYLVQEGDKSGWTIAKNVQVSCDAGGIPVQDPTQPVPISGMNAFYFTTGVSAQASCNDIPTGGMVVETPHGLKVNFELNGISITMSSTAIFQMQPNGQLLITTAVGNLVVESKGVKKNLPANQMLMVPMGGSDGMEASGPPSDPQPANGAILRILTVCRVAHAAGLDVPCSLVPLPTKTPTSTPIPNTCTERTFRSDGTVCIPGYGIYPCNRNGICDPGEHSYICPEDCGAPPPPEGWGKLPTPTFTPCPPRRKCP